MIVKQRPAAVRIAFRDGLQIRWEYYTRLVMIKEVNTLWKQFCFKLLIQTPLVRPQLLNNGKDCSGRLRKASSTSILHSSKPLPVVVVENGPPSSCRLMTEQVNFFYHWTLIRVIYCFFVFCFLPSSQYEELLGVNGLAFICASPNIPFDITWFLDSNLFRFMKKMLMHDHVKSVPWQMTGCYDLLILSVCLCLSVSLSVCLSVCLSLCLSVSLSHYSQRTSVLIWWLILVGWYAKHVCIITDIYI